MSSPSVTFGGLFVMKNVPHIDIISCRSIHPFFENSTQI